MKTGLIYPVIKHRDYVRGRKPTILGQVRSAPFEIINPSGDWTSTVPEGEQQFNERGDSNGCTNFTGTSQVEVVLDFLYKIKENKSERFQAVVSDQRREGNDPQMMHQSINDYGMLDEALLPYTSVMTFDDYLSPKPMTQDLLNKAVEFKEEYLYKHEFIYPIGLSSLAERKRLLLEALKRSPVAVSVYAWLIGPKGLYIKPQGVNDTHYTLLVGGNNDYALAFDSYPPFLKKLDWNSPFFDVAKGIYLRKRTDEEKAQRHTILEKIVELMKQLLALILQNKKKVEVPEIPSVVQKPKATVDDLARAITKYENVNIALNNPGGLRSSPYQNGFIIQKSTGKQLATFATFADGWKGLTHQITIVCNGTSPVYTRIAKDLGLPNCGELTIEQFLNSYAPRYENITEKYIAFIEEYIKVARSTKMKELL